MNNENQLIIEKALEKLYSAGFTQEANDALSALHGGPVPFVPKEYATGAVEPEEHDPGSLMFVSKPSQDKGHSPAAKYVKQYHCKHENRIRKVLEFSDLDRSAMPLPFTHQVSFCSDCWQVVNQEDNRERRALVMAFKKE